MEEPRNEPLCIKQVPQNSLQVSMWVAAAQALELLLCQMSSSHARTIRWVKRLSFQPAVGAKLSICTRK